MNTTAKSMASRVNAGLEPYSGVWGKNQIIHLLKRTMFGAKKSDIDYFLSKTFDETITELLTPTANNYPPPINHYNDAAQGIIDPDVALGETWVGAPITNLSYENPRRMSLCSWWGGLMVNQNRSIEEKMVLFWHNHFATQDQGVFLAEFAYEYNVLLRQYALGNFRDFTKDMTLNRAMLVYLNGFKNNQFAPDENYARELQELFTIGKEGGTPYTEEDVQAAARVLTGHTFQSQTNPVVVFQPFLHDSGNKQFSAFYNNTVINGQVGAAGANEVDELLDMIFAKDEVAIHICRKIYRFFVYYKIDDFTHENVILPLADIFRNNSYNIIPVLETLFKSEHFYDAVNQGCLIKSPVDDMVGLLREFNVAFPTDNIITTYKYWQNLWGFCFITTQAFGNPPSVAGWPAYYQQPSYHEFWINTDTILNRFKVADFLVSFGLPIDGFNLKIKPVEFVAQNISEPGDPNILIDELLELYYSVPVSQNKKNQLKAALTNGFSDSYWFTAWNNWSNTPTNQSYYQIVNFALTSLFRTVVTLAESQLC